MAFAQSTLPPVKPTAVPAAAPASSLTAPTSATPVPASPLGRPAVVSYAAGRIEITADNSSLNQILREISRLSGMTITGGVVDQRVFGKYGPAPASDVLSSLLEGTGTNMLLLDTALNAPSKLVLTPQQGGATPPSPNAPGLYDDTSADDALRRPPDQPPSRPNYPPSIQIPGQFAASGTQAPNPSTGSAAAAPADPGTNSQPPSEATSPSANDARTPQQIYQQLLKLQRSQPPH